MKTKVVIKFFLFLNLFNFGGFVSNAQTLLFSEDFKEGIPAGWEITTTNKQRVWEAKNYKNDFYLNMSAFGGRGRDAIDVKSSVYTPIISDTLTGCKLKFSFADAYSNGQPLSVYITSVDKNIIKKINAKYFSSFVNNTGKYDNIYEATPWISLPELSVPYRIEFRYTSQKKISTTIQLNEVDIWCK